MVVLANLYFGMEDMNRWVSGESGYSNGSISVGPNHIFISIIHPPGWGGGGISVSRVGKDSKENHIYFLAK